MSTAEDYKRLVKEGRALEKEASGHGDKATAAGKRLWAAQPGSAAAKAALVEQREHEAKATDARRKARAKFDRAEEIKMALKKNPAKKRKASPAQIAARKKFVAAVKAGKFRKGAKKKAVRRPAKKRNSKTIIKAKRVTILNLKKNPSFEIHKTLKATKRGNQAGWLLGKKFYAKSAGQRALPGGAILDLGSGFVYRKLANPSTRTSTSSDVRSPTKTSTDAYTSGNFTATVTGGAGRGATTVTIQPPALRGKASKAKRAKKAIGRKKKNIAGFMQDGVFHPIRSGVEQRTTKSGVRRVKSKKAYKPSKVGEKRTYSAKKAAKRGVQSKRMTAATKQRKATTTRLASRSLDRSGPKAKRNFDKPAELLNSFRGYPKNREDNLRFPNGTPAGLYRLGVLKKIITTDATITMPNSQVWLCADTKGKLHVGGMTNSAAGGRVVNSSPGSLGKVKQVEYVEKKPHLGDHNKTLYFHKLGEESGNKPTLHSDGDGNLLFKGGSYYITPEGIRD